MNKKILNLAKDILKVSALEMPQYRSFLLEQAKNLNLWEVEYTWVWIYINLNKPEYIDISMADWYLSSSTLPSTTIRFNTAEEDFDFVVSCNSGYIDLIEIVAPGSIDFWDGNFDTYEFINN